MEKLTFELTNPTLGIAFDPVGDLAIRKSNAECGLPVPNHVCSKCPLKDLGKMLPADGREGRRSEILSTESICRFGTPISAKLAAADGYLDTRQTAVSSCQVRANGGTPPLGSE
jgi:hypothetical protein